MNNSNKPLLIGAPLLVMAALLAGLLLGANLPTRKRMQREPVPDIEKFDEIFAMLDAKYVDPINRDSLVEETIPYILANLDPHTAYIPAEDFENVNADLEGSFSGIGISYQIMNDTITVVEIISGGPSEKVGLMAGDRITAINDSIMTGKGVQMDDVLKLLRGPKGTEVKLGIKRAGAPLTYTIVRDDIPVTSIDASYLINPTTGYIKVNKFGRNTFQEFYLQMLSLKVNGAEDFILDLRGNGGGYLDVAIALANEFLGYGDGIVFTRGRGGVLTDAIGADGRGTFQDGQLIVLMDEFSASSSEIVAGAIQDNDRGLIMGRRSFGKGLVQTQEDLSDGSALRITTARYYTPSGRCIQKPFTKGDVDNYQYEIYDRYLSGEAFSADSVKFDESLIFHTAAGRKVYGGGGIMPDIFVPADTAHITGYYTQVSNAGLLHRFAFNYADDHRARLDKATTADELLSLLPPDGVLLNEFVNFAAANGIATRWYYVNLSRPLIVNLLKALIARDVLGTAAFYEIYNTQDNVVERAVQAIADKSAVNITTDD